MGTLTGSFYRVSGKSNTGEMVQVPILADAVTFDALTTSATADVIQVGGVDWSAPADGVVRLKSDAAEIVRASAAGSDASANVGGRLYADTAATFWVSEGEKLSVVNA